MPSSRPAHLPPQWVQRCRVWNPATVYPLKEVMDPKFPSFSLYPRIDERDAMDWLKAHAEEQGITLSRLVIPSLIRLARRLELEEGAAPILKSRSGGSSQSDENKSK